MHAVADVVMVRAKRIYNFLFHVRCFLKETENTYSVFLSSYRNTRESLGELEKAVETLAAARIPTAFLVLPNFHSCFYNLIETRYMFSISYIIIIFKKQNNYKLKETEVESTV